MLTDTEEKKLLNKGIIFVFFVHKKYSYSYITLQLNHWYHMDYFNNISWALNVSVPFVYRGSERLRFLICVPKMNEGLMGLERHEGE